jgi:hypothetical protein
MAPIMPDKKYPDWFVLQIPDEFVATCYVRWGYQ